eukprot:gnl/TRDRNA2_/TRDRNA2_169330_c0_seq1.p1 gnl/TRDRNA2_/TRDRNA2_169330_c0~~gnl/TRDRNA2_/TRDRNA2_169330_c0_seq1.p1  ORF type:complete len:157 (+),score=14.86 gnl/TRDRNA2_/TRDRNA2_169330_c0_seq1:63-533(+)
MQRTLGIAVSSMMAHSGPKRIGTCDEQAAVIQRGDSGMFSLMDQEEEMHNMELSSGSTSRLLKGASHQLQYQWMKVKPLCFYDDPWPGHGYESESSDDSDEEDDYSDQALSDVSTTVGSASPDCLSDSDVSVHCSEVDSLSHCSDASGSTAERLRL